jgi:hypothetical protein
LTEYKLLNVAAIVGFIYLAWAIGDFFGKGKLINYVKALFAYISGMIAFSVTVFIIGSIIDLIA